MAKPLSFNKRELEKKRLSKRAEKQQRKEDRKASGTDSFEDMIAYVDENGVISSTPPDPTKKSTVNVENIDVSTRKQEDVEEVPLEGRVEHFNTDKGYGFIKSLSSVDKYFFHISNAPDSLVEGNLVTFELERGKKGFNAVNIVVLKK